MHALHTHSPTSSHTCPHTHTLSHLHSPIISLSLSPTLNTHLYSLNLSLAPSLTLTLSLSHTHTHLHPSTHTHTLTHTQLTGQQTSSITVLIHFSTSTANSAQVIVAGNNAGHVTWFISQPPQKTYSILFCDQTSHTAQPIVALQVRPRCW